MPLITGHEKVGLGSNGTFENPVVFFMNKDIRKPDGRSDERGEGVNLGQSFPNLGLSPSEGLVEHGLEFGSDGR